ncbi:UDP-N-acetylmuramate--L-alanine ligase [Anaerostipes faecalis]|uniref:UDP-N-acetylmuramate--L-alanine ligase n=1 Tax=Anaerostipes faecalis TaxID=2738446 RepID=UPI001C1E74B4|nr:UDP-N-acetylmuramate--L-alanine ligase [Anaerostipes faecalis]
MYQIDFNQPIHIHFMGIGGISMSGLAEILLKEGFTISGSDIHSSPITDRLEAKGAKIFFQQTADNITSDIDLVVYTAAINFETNEEYKAAISKGIPVMKRATLLGQLMHNYQNAIAVSGTHGKTTTTSMLSHILLAGDTDPTISVGGILDAIGGNIRVGHSDMFITEACEYTNSFLEFFPKISIILNIEEDHMDFFKDIDDIRHSFREFAHKLPDYGYLVLNGQIDNIPYIVEGLSAEYATFGIDNDTDTFTAKNITYDAFGHAGFDYYKKGQYIDHIQLNVNGEHNVRNALAAIAVADRLNLSMDAVKKGLLSFSGAKRRFELKGTCNDFTIVDDYAHHPTEIKATLNACKNYPHEELWCIFQPHTYTRTHAFLDEFAEALSLSDHVIITDIYAAREKDTGLVSSKDIVDKMAAYDVDVHYIKDFEDIEKFILKNCKKNDLLITMGAGNVDSIGDSLINK